MPKTEREIVHFHLEMDTSRHLTLREIELVFIELASAISTPGDSRINHTDYQISDDPAAGGGFFIHGDLDIEVKDKE